ncbi:MAG: hypothetical protein ACOCV2_10940 [Persicimonas sp.]
MHQAQSLRIHPFDPDAPLLSNARPSEQLPDSTQVRYLKRYLADLGAEYVLEEPNYFDRDFLAEFEAYYGRNVRGYANICRRLHFFATDLTRDRLRRAVGGGPRVREDLQQNYLGFCVIRPIPAVPLGRTVLCWYPERIPNRPRIHEPRRTYHAHVAGLELCVDGLAWQQQDTAVSACATSAIWTMMHSSAFDTRHAVPTTADITRAAHTTASLGDRVFPSTGLTTYQIAEAVKELGLQPMMLDGDVEDESGRPMGFTKERFGSVCSSLVRSGYPVLLGGYLTDDVGADGHALCLVGVREPQHARVAAGEFALQDRNLRHVYLHEDNIGPQVRFEVVEESFSSAGSNHNATRTEDRIIVLKPSAPPQRREEEEYPELDLGSYEFTPTELLVAVHDDVRLDFDDLQSLATEYGEYLAWAVDTGVQNLDIGFSGSSRIFRLAEYVEDELERQLRDSPTLLAKARLGIWEEVPPMSLHIGVVRFGSGASDDARPDLDLLVDTTELAHNEPVFAHVAYRPLMEPVIAYLEEKKELNFGVGVEAF